ncbi:hypothetical protein GSI_04374 [Ganoderma sinense ZZ0214-1]|uniref:Uncharacterized protein n=1 Tax=Ganoderma sinense ZZ0214-1 TaxID=1077348 RepID=A0A2G8SJ06_9APHY|nr:hypothetical protein GSI_04374 [Ganoderma sinense ZZ0214-1]
MSRTTTTTTILQSERDTFVPQGEPSFADVVYVLTTPPPDASDADTQRTWDLSSRIPHYVTLFAYSLAHPQQFASWVNDTWKIGKTIEDAKHPEVRRKWAGTAKDKTVYAFSVAIPFLFAPQGPEARARETAEQPIPVYGPPEHDMMRIKWYPNLQATNRWPEHMGQLWVDVPLERDGCLDLRFVKALWGMQNCYVIDPNRSKPHLSRRPVEKLSPLAVNVLLADGHKVIGVVERPSEHLQVARKYRAYVKDQARPFFLEAIPRFLWQTLALLATIAFNLAVNMPYFLWFLVCSSPYILFHALEIVFLFAFAVGTLVVRDLEELGYVVQDYLTPYACEVFTAAREWLVAGLEAAFLTEEEIRRRTMLREGSEVSDVSEE